MTLAHLGLLRVLPAFIAVMTVAEVQVGTCTAQGCQRCEGDCPPTEATSAA